MVLMSRSSPTVILGVLFLFTPLIWDGVAGSAIRPRAMVRPPASEMGALTTDYVYDVPMVDSAAPALANLPPSQNNMGLTGSQLRAERRIPSFGMDDRERMTLSAAIEPFVDVDDTGDDLRYQQEELIFSPGSVDEVRVRPDGTSYYAHVAAMEARTRNNAAHQRGRGTAEDEAEEEVSEVAAMEGGDSENADSAGLTLEDPKSSTKVPGDSSFDTEVAKREGKEGKEENQDKPQDIGDSQGGAPNIVKMTGMKKEDLNDTSGMPQNALGTLSQILLASGTVPGVAPAPTGISPEEKVKVLTGDVTKIVSVDSEVGGKNDGEDNSTAKEQTGEVDMVPVNPVPVLVDGKEIGPGAKLSLSSDAFPLESGSVLTAEVTVIKESASGTNVEGKQEVNVDGTVTNSSTPIPVEMTTMGGEETTSSKPKAAKRSVLVGQEGREESVTDSEENPQVMPVSDASAAIMAPVASPAVMETLQKELSLGATLGEKQEAVVGNALASAVAAVLKEEEKTVGGVLPTENVGGGNAPEGGKTKVEKEEEDRGSEEEVDDTKISPKKLEASATADQGTTGQMSKEQVNNAPKSRSPLEDATNEDDRDVQDRDAEDEDEDSEEDDDEEEIEQAPSNQRDSRTAVSFGYMGRHSAVGNHGRRRRDLVNNDISRDSPRNMFTASVRGEVPHSRRRSKRSVGEYTNGPVRELGIGTNGHRIFVDIPLEHRRLSRGGLKQSVEGARRPRQTLHEFVNLGMAHSRDRKFPRKFCELDRDSGHLCPGVRRGIYMEQFFYSDETNKCAHFVYNGCGGNANRFSTLWECTQHCGRPKWVDNSIDELFLTSAN